jgi:hypothetical protein
MRETSSGSDRLNTSPMLMPHPVLTNGIPASFKLPMGIYSHNYLTEKGLITDF